MTPQAIIDLYIRSQIDQAMDGPTLLGGNDRYEVKPVLEAIAEMAGWELPPELSFEEMEQYLRDNGREDEIEMLDC